MWIAVFAAAVAGTYQLGWILLFDFSRPAGDRDTEYVQGKQAAWGPYPRTDEWSAELFAIPPQRLFRGNELLFVLYRSRCENWVLSHGYVIPSSGRGR